MSINVSVQRVLTGHDDVTIPDDNQIRHWVDQAVQQSGQTHNENLLMSVRIVDAAEITELNRTYRGKDKPTNVLSFPFEAPPGLPADELEDELGDIIVCAEVVETEAQEQHKTREAHWAHMIIHGTLHLLGYDHETEAEAGEMESLEKRIMQQLGYADPYE